MPKQGGGKVASKRKVEREEEEEDEEDVTEEQGSAILAQLREVKELNAEMRAKLAEQEAENERLRKANAALEALLKERKKAKGEPLSAAKVEAEDDGTGTKAGAAAAASSSSAVGGAAPTNPACIQTAEADTFFLTDKKRVTVSVFKGSVNVNIREFYEKDGEMLPSPKGIALTPEQWQRLCAHVPATCAALKSNDTKFSQDLGAMRRVTISPFGGALYVQVREYYEKGGGLLPGKKGIGLRTAEWEKLQEFLGDINRCVDKREKVHG